jgi:hypothetical protein
MSRPVLDLTGHRFGHLVARCCAGRNHHPRSWYCDCDCGQRGVLIAQVYLRSGDTRSCGCLRRQATRQRRLGTGGRQIPIVVRLRDQGLTGKEIGARLGLTYQRIYQILRRANHPVGRVDRKSRRKIG